MLLYNDIRKYLKTGGALLDPILMCDYQCVNKDIQMKGGGRFQKVNSEPAKAGTPLESLPCKTLTEIVKRFTQIAKMSLQNFKAKIKHATQKVFLSGVLQGLASKAEPFVPIPEH